MAHEAKYPHVKFQLVGVDGNAFAVMGLAAREARRAGLTKEQIQEYQTDAMSCDYNKLLCTTMEYFDCSGCLPDDDTTEEEINAEWDEHWAEMDSFQEDDDD